MDRREFDELVALKKLKQGGEGVTGTSNDFEKIDYSVEQTSPDKVKNFWYHHKWKVLSAVCACIVLSVLIWQMASREHYDMNVIIAAATFEEGKREFYEAELSDLSGSAGLEFVQIVDVNDQITLAYKQRFIGSLATGRARYYVLDDYVYEFYEDNLKDSFSEVRKLSNGFTLYEVKEK